MGSTDFYPEEAPVRAVSVDGFAIDRHPVTNAQFGEFVSATGYVTIAEKRPDPVAYPDVDPADLIAGAMVFRPTSGPVNLRDWRQWWDWVPDANWRRPFGPGSDIDGKAGTLTYRGYSIHDLAEHSTFEEVAHLLIHGVDRLTLFAYRPR